MNLKKAAQKKLKKSGGFTLVEMLIVVAIIAILVVVSIPLVGNSLDKARTATDDANKRAAEAAATIQYMLMETPPAGSKVTYFYDANSGQAKQQSNSNGIAGYNQSTKNGATVGAYCVKVEITVETGATNATWVSANSGG